MGPVGVQEMIVIFLVALVLFGPKKLPELGKTIAKAITAPGHVHRGPCIPTGVDSGAPGRCHPVEHRNGLAKVPRETIG